MRIAIEQLYGNWQALTGILAGNPMPEKIVSATRLTISPNHYVVDLAGIVDRGSCSLNVEASPVQMQIEGTEGPNAGKTFFAVVEFVAETEIQIAYDLSGTGYPKSFEPMANDSSYVATFKKC